MLTVKLKAIFNSSGWWLRRGWRADWDRLERWLDHEAVLLNCDTINPPDLTPDLPRVSGHGGIHHEQLMQIAAGHLTELGYVYETTAPARHGIADIMSDDGTIVIECGDTNPANVIKALSGQCQYFCVLPFQDPDPPYTLWFFERGPMWQEYELQKRRDDRKNSPVIRLPLPSLD